MAQADLDRGKAQDEQQREAERIRLTRELDVKIAEANSQATGLQRDSEASKRLCGEHRTSLARYQGEMQATEALLGSCRDFLHDHRADADPWRGFDRDWAADQDADVAGPAIGRVPYQAGRGRFAAPEHGAGAATGGNQLGRSLTGSGCGGKPATGGTGSAHDTFAGP
ncbi:MAG: hypothetical protein MZV70_41295 [Desulfobacterales bacterium]|nr:hypothetical protein [Desulfobacterales bacterium]